MSDDPTPEPVRETKIGQAVRPTSSVSARVTLPRKQRLSSSISNLAKRQNFKRRGEKPGLIHRPGAVGRTDAAREAGEDV